MPADGSSYVEVRMREWCMDKQPRRLQAAVRKVLSELEPSALLCIKDKRLEVRVVRDFACESKGAWAYFPIWPRWSLGAQALADSGITFNEFAESACRDILDMDLLGRRLIAMQLFPRAETRVLLVISIRAFEAESPRAFEATLRDRFGHVLLYLRDPRARNECKDAWREWCENRRPVSKRAKPAPKAE